MHDLTTIQSLVHSVRRDRLEDHHYTPETEPPASPLLGECHINARTLAQRLHEEGYDPYLRWGAINYSEERAPPESISEAEDQGLIHFWVELYPEDDQAPYVLDLAQKTEDDPGQALIARELPRTYVRLPGSLIEYHPDIAARNLRSLMDYQVIESRGYVVEGDPVAEAL